MSDAEPFKLVLASGSPRRKELLNSMGVQFSVLVTDTDESLNDDQSPQDNVMRLAKNKAFVAQQNVEKNKYAILAADTIVCQELDIFNKPIDMADAISTWQQLSNAHHQVMTAVCLLANDKCYSSICTTEVRFAEISSAQMKQYWLSGEPQDKAGAYAIQGLASAWVQEVNGSYSNVVGLPLFEVNKLLSKIGLNWL